jgi:hypothetical protein
MVLLASVLTCGCSTSRELIKDSRVSTRSDVFREVVNGSPIPRGYADLQIVSSLKTHRQGVYPLRTDAHGTPDYALLLTIDGQVVEMKGTLTEEILEPGYLQDPEEGDGIRYAFRKVVRLKAGTHTVIVASPDDEVTVERGITLAEGSSNTLLLEPVYRSAAANRRPGYYSPTSFYGGIRAFRLMLNARPL